MLSATVLFVTLTGLLVLSECVHVQMCPSRPAIKFYTNNCMRCGFKAT